MRYVFISAAWLLVAIGLGASGVLLHLRPPAPQLILTGLTIALLTAWRLNQAFRKWIVSVDLRSLIALHLTRFVGFYFLVLCRRGELPCDFAVPAGWGDVVVATLALVLLATWHRMVTLPGLLGAWNALGLIDILFVVGSAARHAIPEPASMVALLRLPLSLLVTFLVPLIISSHIFIFGRLLSARRAVGLQP